MSLLECYQKSFRETLYNKASSQTSSPPRLSSATEQFKKNKAQFESENKTVETMIREFEYILSPTQLTLRKERDPRLFANWFFRRDATNPYTMKLKDSLAKLKTHLAQMGSTKKLFEAIQLLNNVDLRNRNESDQQILEWLVQRGNIFIQNLFDHKLGTPYSALEAELHSVLNDIQQYLVYIYKKTEEPNPLYFSFKQFTENTLNQTMTELIQKTGNRDFSPLIKNRLIYLAESQGIELEDLLIQYKKIRDLSAVLTQRALLHSVLVTSLTHLSLEYKKSAAEIMGLFMRFHQLSLTEKTKTKINDEAILELMGFSFQYNKTPEALLEAFRLFSNKKAIKVKAKQMILEDINIARLLEVHLIHGSSLTDISQRAQELLGQAINRFPKLVETYSLTTLTRLSYTFNLTAEEAVDKLLHLDKLTRFRMANNTSFFFRNSDLLRSFALIEKFKITQEYFIELIQKILKREARISDDDLISIIEIGLDVKENLRLAGPTLGTSNLNLSDSELFDVYQFVRNTQKGETEWRYFYLQLKDRIELRLKITEEKENPNYQKQINYNANIDLAIERPKTLLKDGKPSVNTFGFDDYYESDF